MSLLASVLLVGSAELVGAAAKKKKKKKQRGKQAASPIVSSMSGAAVSCAVCEYIVHALDSSIKLSLSKDQTYTSGFRLKSDGRRATQRVPWAQSEVGFMEIMDDICAPEQFAAYGVVDLKTAGQFQLLNNESDYWRRLKARPVVGGSGGAGTERKQSAIISPSAGADCRLMRRLACLLRRRCVAAAARGLHGARCAHILNSHDAAGGAACVGGGSGPTTAVCTVELKKWVLK
jgi:hypothetical protein